MVLEACLCALALQLPAPAATLSGTVRDAATGQALPGVGLVLGDVGRRTVTDANGHYRFAGVPAGPQHLSASLLGYAPRTVHALVPALGRVELDLALPLRPLRLPSLQAAFTAPLPPDDPRGDVYSPDRTVSAAVIRSHPSLPEPDPFLALAGGGVVLEPEAPAGVHVHGGAPDQTGYLIDGVPVLSPYHAAGLFSAVNPDAVAQVGLAAAAPPPALPDALSGTITLTTRTPGDRLQARGSASNTQTRLTADGPLGAGGGYLLSWRTSFPADVWRHEEPSYLVPESGDLLVTAHIPWLGGRAGALLYDTENEISASTGRAPPDAARNRFAWASRSFGAHWRRHAGASSYLLRAWSASLDAASSWSAEPSLSRLQAKRGDAGVQASYAHDYLTGRAEYGVRLQRIHTDYRAVADRSGLHAHGAVLLGTLYAEHTRAVRTWLNAWAGASLTYAGDVIHLSPRARLDVRGPRGLTGSLAYSRMHQFAQSVRNPESVAGRIFPADLFLAAGVADMPVPRSDQLVAAAAWRPSARLRVELQAFTRALDRLVLVRDSEPFALAPAATGSGRARGASLELGVNDARYNLLLSYGWQRVRLARGDTTYSPSHGSAHLFDAGLSIYPGATSQLRVALSGAAGRRGTAIAGPFEWETCNLLDQGCEFAGTPRLEGALGAVRLPAYLRVDVGGRQHWHLRLASRDAQVALFGTITNVFGRRNVLTYVRDPDGGSDQAVEMLPRAPLVIGLDWQF